MLKEVNITQEVLQKSAEDVMEYRKGPFKSSYNNICAIATALKPEFPNVLVGASFIALSGDTTNGDCTISSPKEVINFIRKFDSVPDKEKAYLEPISFTIEIPDNAQELCNPK